MWATFTLQTHRQHRNWWESCSQEQACPAVGTEIPGMFRWARLDVSHCPGARVLPGVTWEVPTAYFMAPNSLVATPVVLPFDSNLSLSRFRLSTDILQHHANSALRPTTLDVGSLLTKILEGICTWNITEYSGYNTDMGLAKNNYSPTEGSDWWYRSGGMCTYDCTVLIGCWPNPALESML